MIRSDFSISIRFVVKEQKSIFKILFLAVSMNFLLAGIGTIGIPYIIRTVLGLSAEYFGAAESLMGAAAIAGGLAVGALVTRLKTRKLFWLVFFLGISTVCMCAMPLGQMLYGFLLDRFSGAIFGVFIASGIITACLGLASRRSFQELDAQSV